jgi:hypothetical protein
MPKPFLVRFAEYREETPMPAMRCNPITLTAEVLQGGVWVSGLEHDLLSGGRGTKTSVKSESTDYH